MLSQNNLEAIFKEFDKDGDGKVTRDEIKTSLSMMKNLSTNLELVAEKIMSEVDEN